MGRRLQGETFQKVWLDRRRIGLQNGGSYVFVRLRITEIKADKYKDW